jgi:hypothetical protein
MTSASKVDHLAKAQTCWQPSTPDWIVLLAEVCNAEGQASAGRRIGYSASAVSSILSNSYKGDMVGIEATVRGVLMAETVMCPVAGELGRNVCASWQKRPFSTASANAVRMHQACRSGCPHSRLSIYVPGEPE